MKFSEFARRLKAIISDEESSTGGNFAKELFRNILKIEDEKLDLDEDISMPTYRAYFRGDRDKSRFATKIRKYIEP